MDEPVVLMLYRQLQFLDFISPHVMESGIREVLLVESGIRDILSFGIRNPGVWIPECSTRNPESH